MFGILVPCLWPRYNLVYVIFNYISFYEIKYLDIGALNIYSEVQTNQTVKPVNTLWSIDRNRGDNWYIARVPTEYTSDFRIIFEGNF